MRFIQKKAVFFRVYSGGATHPTNKFIKSRAGVKPKICDVSDKLLGILRILKSYSTPEKNCAPVIFGLLMTPVCGKRYAQEDRLVLQY